MRAWDLARGRFHPLLTRRLGLGPKVRVGVALGCRIGGVLECRFCILLEGFLLVAFGWYIVDISSRLLWAFSIYLGFVYCVNIGIELYISPDMMN